ncbi:MAG: helix-turn-helix domain-containing protein [Limnochordia bacterium]|nr:helix-turn-helix transcriptional regulator [Clostridiales bacterium]
MRSVLIVARKAKGMKVKEAAHKLGISSSFYYKIERFFGSPS